MILRLLPLIAALTVANIATAADTDRIERMLPDWASFQIGSKHINMNESNVTGAAGFQEFNPGLIVTWGDRWRGLNYSIGNFRNSNNERSTILAVSDLYPIGKGFFVGWFLGTADYGEVARNSKLWKLDSDWIPIGGLQLNYRNYYMQVLPANDSGKGFGAVLTFGVSMALKRGENLRH